MTARRNHRRDRSPESDAYQFLYKRAIWCGKGGLRDQQLKKEPLCEPCKRRGRIVSATVVHHVEPHKGDYSKFTTGKLASVCADCHNGPLQSQEARKISYSKEIDPKTGQPTDPRHPFNA